jgi:predicted ester cyclase
MVEAGDVIAFEVTWSGTHLGPLSTDSGDVPPTGKRMEIAGAGFNRMNEDGRIIEQNRYYDMAGILTQLELT